MSGFDAALLNITQQSRYLTHTPTPTPDSPSIGQMTFNLFLSGALSTWQTASKLGNQQAASLEQNIRQEVTSGAEYKARYDKEVAPILKWTMWGDPLGSYQLNQYAKITTGQIDQQEQKRIEKIQEHNTLREISHLQTLLGDGINNIEDYDKWVAKIDQDLRNKQQVSPEWGNMLQTERNLAEQTLFKKSLIQSSAQNESEARYDFINTNLGRIKPDTDIGSLTSKIYQRKTDDKDKRTFLTQYLTNVTTDVGQELFEANRNLFLPTDQNTIQQAMQTNDTIATQNGQSAIRSQDNYVREQLTQGHVPAISPKNVGDKSLADYLDFKQKYKYDIVQAYGFSPAAQRQAGLDILNTDHPQKGEIANWLFTTANGMLASYQKDFPKALNEDTTIPMTQKGGLRPISPPEFDDKGRVIPSTRENFLASLKSRFATFFDLKSRLYNNDREMTNALSAAERVSIGNFYQSLPNPSDQFDLLKDAHTNIDSFLDGAQNLNLFNMAGEVLGEPNGGMFLQIERMAPGEGKKAFILYKNKHDTKNNAHYSGITKMENGYIEAFQGILNGTNVTPQDLRGLAALAISQDGYYTEKQIDRRIDPKNGLIKSSMVSSAAKYAKRSNVPGFENLFIPGEKVIKDAQGQLIEKLRMQKINDKYSLMDAIKAQGRGIDGYIYTIQNVDNDLTKFRVMRFDKEKGTFDQIIGDVVVVKNPPFTIRRNFY